jgi:hypothetical protein
MPKVAQKLPQDSQDTRPLNVRGCIEIHQAPLQAIGFCETGCTYRGTAGSYGGRVTRATGLGKKGEKVVATSRVLILGREMLLCKACAKEVKKFWDEFCKAHVVGDPQAQIKKDKAKSYKSNSQKAAARRKNRKKMDRTPEGFTRTFE